MKIESNSPTNVSYNLSLLRLGGLIDYTKKGCQKFYHLSHSGELLVTLCRGFLDARRGAETDRDLSVPAGG